MSATLETPKEMLLPIHRLTEGLPVTVDTIRRWCERGLLTKQGERIKVESKRYGKRLFASREALQRFLEAMEQ